MNKLSFNYLFMYYLGKQFTNFHLFIYLGLFIYLFIYLFIF